MQLRLLAKDDKSLDVELGGENETLLNLLKQRLLRNEKIDSATYLTGHPLLDAPRLVVHVKSGKADAHVKQAAKEIRETFDEFETQFLKATQGA